MKFIEDIIEQYYVYSKAILWTCCMIFTIAIISGFCTFIKNRRYTITRLIYKMIYSLAVTGIGILFSLTGLELKIEYANFDAVTFLLIVAVIVLYWTLLCNIFEQIMELTMKCCRYIQCVVYLELALLAVTCHLDFWEWTTGTLGIICTEVFIMWLEEEISKQRKKKEKEIKKESDFPDSNLFPTRRRQFERFIEVLEQQEDEPYAIMISGEWGAGKSSFVKALSETWKEKDFKWVFAGSEKTVSEIMKEVSIQIIEVLEQNNIYIERKDLIEKYFFAFSGLFKDTILVSVRKIMNTVFGGKEVDEKNYLNSKLDALGKMIYLIIDDLDRCDEEYQEKMFKVIRESMTLHYCKVIFLVDKAKFLCKKGEDNYDYIEKYVSYSLDLCNVDYQELARCTIDNIIDGNCIEEMNAVLLKGRSAAQIKEMIYSFPGNLIERLENEISKEEKNFQPGKDNETAKLTKEKIHKIRDGILQIKKSIVNPRKVKRYLKGIKRNTLLLNMVIEEVSEELLNEDWFKAILKVQFVKNFMSETFNDIKMCGDIWQYGQKYDDHVISIIFDLYYHYLKHDERKEAVINYIINKMDVADLSEAKTLKGNFLDELRTGKGSIDHMESYMIYAENYEDLSEILHIYETQDLNEITRVYLVQRQYDYVFLEKFLSMLFKALMNHLTRFNSVGRDFLKFSDYLVVFLSERELTEREKAYCINESNVVLRKIISGNLQPLFNVLSIVFDLSVIENSRNFLTIPDIDELYEMLKFIDKAGRFRGLEDGRDKLSSMKRYFHNLEIELKNEKYNELKSIIENSFLDIKNLFSACEFWSNIDYRINNGEKGENAAISALKRYFLLESGYRCRDIVFSDTSSLVEALKVLKKFYDIKQNDYRSDYSHLLFDLSFNLVLKYEQDFDWFRNEQPKIAELLQEVTELACTLDKGTAYHEKNIIAQIRIYTYRFHES